jgi:hypothetical protein
MPSVDLFFSSPGDGLGCGFEAGGSIEERLRQT